MFRRMSKRRRRGALCVALIDRVQWGPPRPVTGDEVVARHVGMCVGCGSSFDVGEPIVLASYGPPQLNAQAWVHLRCPDLWDLLGRTVESRDSKIVTGVAPVGRRRASGCGHDVRGRPVYLVRRPVGLDQPNHSDWFCEECVTA